MWRAISAVLCGVVLALSCLLWIESAKRRKAEDETAAIKLSLLSARRDAVQASLDLGRIAGAEKERRIIAVTREASDAAVSIATAQSEPEGVDIDALLPLSLTDFRHGLRNKICAGGACGHP